jgi:hypothetical protein
MPPAAEKSNKKPPQEKQSVRLRYVGGSALLLSAQSGKPPSHTRRACARTAADARTMVLRRWDL